MTNPALSPAVAMRGVSFAYDGDPVLDGVDLELERGCFACVVGPNGGGKTTLMKLILGQLTPRTGEVRVLGDRPEAARSRIGYMPQYAQLDPKFPVDVTDVVLMGRLGPSRSWGRPSNDDRLIVARCLDEVGMGALSHRPFAALSGGQRQRVLIARALASEPELLLLDEPTANLDMRVERDVYELLKTLNRRLSIVLVSHDFGFVSSFVRTVLCVHRHVHIHPTEDVSEGILSELYGSKMKMVLHNKTVSP